LDFTTINLAHERQFNSIRWTGDIPQPFWMREAMSWIGKVKEHRVNVEEGVAKYQALSEEMEEAADEFAKSKDRTMAERRVLLQRVADLDKAIKHVLQSCAY
jgi:predicted metal-binding transcription factor (methanogenesis marker protein 9)